MRVAVIGAGISGLAAAYHVKQMLGSAVEVTIYEAANRVGGVIFSETIQRNVFEAGPDTLFVKQEDLKTWLIQLGLAPEMIYPRADTQAAWRVTAAGKIAGPSSTEQGISFRQGMVAQPNQLVGRFDGTIELGHPIIRLEPSSSGLGWQLFDHGSTIRADGVVLAVPAPVAARLLEDCYYPALAKQLADIVHRPRAIVAALYHQNVVPAWVRMHAGFWIDAKTPWLMDACSILSSKWDYPDVTEYVTLRTFWGARQINAEEWPDVDLKQQHRKEMQVLADVMAEPVAWRIYRWHSALPQVSDEQRLGFEVQRQQLAQTHPTLAVTGAYMGGVGVASCITDAIHSVDAWIARIDSSRQKSVESSVRFGELDIQQRGSW
jgi:protoporphyrinogen oxidase